MPKISIAIDGPCASGKSTAAKMVANKYGMIRVDSGLFYRGVTYVMFKRGIKKENEIKVALSTMRFELIKEDLYFENENISNYCRSENIDKNVSFYASIKIVREYVNNMIRSNLNNNDSSHVVDGRDIGSVVLPNANIKFYLTASAEIRAQRRVKQQESLTYKNVLDSIKQRDFTDTTRKIDPLMCVEDAIVIENDNMSLEETVLEMSVVIDRYLNKNS